MTGRLSRTAVMVTVAISATLLLAALPGAVAARSHEARACHVMNQDQGFSRGSLQRAVWAAEPGDTLLWRGTCVGTTLIKKDLRIMGFAISGMECTPGARCRVLGNSGLPTLRSGSWRPTIVVDPRVESLEVASFGRIGHGVIVDEVANWKRQTRVAPVAWRSDARAAGETNVIDRSRGRRACAVTNLDSRQRFARLQAAVDAAVEGDHLSFHGRCAQPVRIDKSLHIQGRRAALGNGSRRTTGVPVAGRVVVAAGVEDVTLKHLAITGGFAVE